jgi:hypothetical protein
MDADERAALVAIAIGVGCIIVVGLMLVWALTLVYI